MEKINLPRAAQLTSPNPVTLVCTRRPDGGTNLATVSWWTYLSFNPGMIAFAMSQKSYSGERVRETRRVVLTIPGADIAEAVMACGMCTGRDTDKVAKLCIEMREIPGGDIQVPLHSRVAIQCALKAFVEVGDHYLYICDVEQVLGDAGETALFAWNGYSEIRPVPSGQ